MAEYIEREAVLRQIDIYFDRTDPCGDEQIGVLQCRRIVRERPAADVVEVPCRCKDCKHWKHFDHLGCTDFVKVCGLANYMIGANGYCLYGERRERAGGGASGMPRPTGSVDTSSTASGPPSPQGEGCEEDAE